MADQSPDHTGAKFQQIEDSEDELIAGAAEDAQQQQLLAAGGACEFVPFGRNARIRVREAGYFSCFVSPVGVRAPQFLGGLAACADLSVPLKEVTRRMLEEIARNPVDLGIPCRNVQTRGVHRMVARHFGPGERCCGFMGLLLCCSECGQCGSACGWLCVWTG